MHARDGQEISSVLIGVWQHPVAPHALKGLVQAVDAAPVAGPDLQTTLDANETPGC